MRNKALVGHEQLLEKVVWSNYLEMPIKGNQSIKVRDKLSTSTQNREFQHFLLVFYKFTSRLFQIPSLVLDVLSKHFVISKLSCFCS